jgi:FAD/FMN-containing dehydrogenase
MPIYQNKKRDAKKQRIAAWQQTSHAAIQAQGLDPAALAALEQSIQGTVAVPGDPVYVADQKNWNPAFDDQPAIIVFCEVPGDVRASLRFAEMAGLAIACRSGGHSTAGFCLANKGMVIDLSRMNDVYVDTGARRAIVGPGTQFHKLNAMLDGTGLHVPGGGCPDVCVAGYMQGGGYGFTARMFGMNCDNVLEVRVMLHDGRTVIANAVDNPDLFWAVRGGTGNNFGVLLQITYQLHPLGDIWAFGLLWELDQAAVALNHLQQHYMRDNRSTALGYQGVLALDKGKRLVAMRGMYNGTRDEGLAAIDGMMRVGHARLEMEGTGSYDHWNDALLASVDDAIQGSRDGFPLKEDKISNYIGRVLSVAEWQEILDYWETSPDAQNAIGMEIYGGAINGRPVTGNAFVHRDVYCDLFVDGFWYNPPDADATHTWIDGFQAVLSKFANGHSYQNYPRRDDADYRWKYWGDAYNSLLFVKQKFDPYNVFRFEQGITPYPDDPAIHKSTAPSLFSDPAIVYG